MTYTEEELRGRFEQKVDLESKHQEQEKNLETIQAELNTLETSLNQKKNELQAGANPDHEFYSSKNWKSKKTIVGSQAKNSVLEITGGNTGQARTELDELIKTQDAKIPGNSQFASPNTQALFQRKTGST
jgi:hypothetical protein